MHHQVIFKEKYGQYGREIAYIKPADQKTVVRIGSNYSFRRTFLDVIVSFFRQIFLPHSYPHSVSEDYYNYQKWDTIQAFCSTITGTLTTRAILTGVGVGDETATPLAATVTMILKDGTGMVGKILFTWWKSSSFDSNCKQWRLFADIINDAALFLELGVPFFSKHVTEILCISTTFKALVGVAGGATRAAITQHQAVKDNVADVSAKDGSQETIVNLIASFSGIYILSYLHTPTTEWNLFFILTAMHIYANYKAVKSLRMKTLNSPRFLLLLQTYISQGVILTPDTVNALESVFLGCGLNDVQLCGFKISLGDSLSSAASSVVAKAEVLKLLTNIQKKRPYLIMTDTKKRRIHVILRQNEKPQDVIKAYFHAVMLGIATCITAKESLQIFTNKAISSPLSHLMDSMSSYMQGMSSDDGTLPPLGKSQRLPIEAMIAVEDLVDDDLDAFMGGIAMKGWITENHQFVVDEWRATW